MTKKSKTLRDLLEGAVNQREAAMRNIDKRDRDRQRKDFDQIRVSIGRIRVFLSGYPFASDERVVEWCSSHGEDLARVVPANSRRTIAALTGSGKLVGC